MPFMKFLRNCEIVRNREFAKLQDRETAKPPIRGFAFAAVSLRISYSLPFLWGI